VLRQGLHARGEVLARARELGDTLGVCAREQSVQRLDIELVGDPATRKASQPWLFGVGPLFDAERAAHSQVDDLSGDGIFGSWHDRGGQQRRQGVRHLVLGDDDPAGDAPTPLEGGHSEPAADR
jgi:hypothetical protein